MNHPNDFVIENGILIEYNGPGGDVVIPEGVTSVGLSWEYPFKDCETLTGITIPEGVERIENYAFCGCRNLKNVILPKSLRTIEIHVFERCECLTEIVFPEDLESIGKGAFAFCTNLKAVSLPKGLVCIEPRTFESCWKLRSVTLPEQLQAIEESAFLGCNTLQEIRLPEGLQRIGKMAFLSCNGLKELALPDSLEPGSIGEYAFPVACKLVASPGSYAAQYAEETAVHPEDFIMEGGVLKRYIGADRIVRIPSGVTVIGEKAFYGDNSIHCVMMPEGVKKIEDEAFMDCRFLVLIVLPTSLTEVGERAFWRCVHLSLKIGPPEIEISHTAWQEEMKETWSRDFVFDRSCVTKYLGPGGDAANRYEKKNPTVDVVIPDGVTRIGKRAFRMWENIRSVSFPAGLICIGCQAFGNCRGITELVLPEGLRMLDDYAFEKCKTLKSVTLPESLEKVGVQVFSPQYRLSEVTVKEWTPLVTEAFKGCELEIIHTEDISKVPTRYRTAAAVGYACEESPDPDSERGKAHVACLKQNMEKLAEKAMKYPELLHFLLENRLLTGKDLDLYIKEAEPSRRRGINEIRKALYHYRNELESSERGVPKEAAPQQTQEKSTVSSAGNPVSGNEDLKERAGSGGEKESSLSAEPEQTEKPGEEEGPDDAGGVTWDLGNQTVTARFQEDFSYHLFSSKGKEVKSIPKAGTDPEKYEQAKEGLAELKKTAKDLLRARKKTLFGAFLSGDSQWPEEWREHYLTRPVLRVAAGTLVWAQGENTFTVTQTGLIDSAGAAYALTDEPIRVAYPLEMEPEDVAAWQKYFLTNGIRQPFSQIWEPVIREEDVKPDRYDLYVLPMSRFLYMTEHGINFYYNRYAGYGWDDPGDVPDVFGITLRSCRLTYEPSISVMAFLAEGFNATKFEKFTLGEFTYQVYNRQVNHIVGLLDQWVAEERIKKNDPDVMDFVSGFTLKQLTECIAFSEEKKKVRVRKLLEAYREERYPGIVPMERFVRIW